MSKKYTLILDAGTSYPRCFIFDEKGNITTASSGKWQYSMAQYLSREFDAHDIWDVICLLVRSTLQKSNASSNDIAAVGITSQRQGVAFLDHSGRELYIGPNIDARAIFEGAVIDEEFGHEVYKTTGHRPAFLSVPAKLHWFQVHQPEIYTKITIALSLADWISWRLTGETTSETTLAAEMGLLDIHDRHWASKLMYDMGLAVNDNVPLVQATDIVGQVSAIAAKDSGLKQGIPVVTCGPDTQCGLLGTGTTETSQVGIITGWSTPLQMVTACPILCPKGKTWAGCFLTDNKWVLESSAGDTGNSYQWLAHMLYSKQTDAFDFMDAEAGIIAPGAEGTSVFLGPPQMNMNNLGLRMGGLLFPIPLTHSDTKRGHLVRASLEAIAYAIRANLEQIEGLANTQAASIHVGGGMTRTQTFVGVLADVIGREITVSNTPHVSALGAYLCVGTALGRFEQLEESAEISRSLLKYIEPDRLRVSEYSDHYARWRDTSERLGQFEI